MDLTTRDVHGSIELPPELWERILRQDLEPTAVPSWNTREDLKSLSLVCRLLKRLCQEFLFKQLSLNLDVRVDYKNLAFQSNSSSPIPGWGYNGTQWPIQPWMWEDWERGMRKSMRSEGRLTLIGQDDFLAAQPRCLKVRGYEISHYYPGDPFGRPSERQALSRAAFDSRHRFGLTLVNRLPAFINLRRLELCNYPVDTVLLNAVESHQSLTELRFDFCWFPESTSPLTSITSLSFGKIPGSYLRPYIYIPGYEPYKGIPDHHIASAFDLISPAHLEHLDISIGSDDSSATFVLGQLCARTAGKGGFQRLHTLEWRFQSQDEPPPGSLILEFLGRTPAIRELSVRGYLSPFTQDAFIPARHIPLLETLICPFDWMRLFVPGRPIKALNLWLPESREQPAFLCRTEVELDDLLGPIALSSTPVTNLHLPYYPPVAPLPLLMPYLTARFPLIRDLKVAVSGECVSEMSYGFRCGTRGGPPMPYTAIEEQTVEDGLLESLEGEMRGDVEATLATFSASQYQVSNLPPILDRIMAFRGIYPEGPKEEDVQNSPIYSQPVFVPVSISPSPSLQDDDQGQDHEGTTPKGGPSTPLAEYFSEIGSNGVPEREPESALDLLYFISRGYYPLPPSLETLHLCSCFGNVSSAHHSRVVRATSKSNERPPYDIEEEQHRLCTEAVLADVSQRYTKLSLFHSSDSVFGHRNHGRRGLYSKVDGQREVESVWRPI